jgi:hypothetical protein
MQLLLLLYLIPGAAAEVPHPFVKICSVSQCSRPNKGATNPEVTPKILPPSPPAACPSNLLVGHAWTSTCNSRRTKVTYLLTNTAVNSIGITMEHCCRCTWANITPPRALTQWYSRQSMRVGCREKPW